LEEGTACTRGKGGHAANLDVLLYYWDDRDGASYEGSWIDSRAEGPGRFVFIDGDKYVGQWQANMFHGMGVYDSGNGTIYFGQWVEDEREGLGVEHGGHTSQVKYCGGFFNGQKHGKGRFEWPDGSVYEGDFRNNNVEGEGTFTWPDGRVYRGQWVKGKQHGPAPKFTFRPSPSTAWAFIETVPPL